MPNVFHPDHSALDQVFAKDMKFIIPEYQRPYSWKADGKNDSNNQINRLWEDLWTFFREMNDDKEYFLGSMVIIEKRLRTLEVVDGQQRLTSLLLLFTAMRCFLERVSGADRESSPDLEEWFQRARSKLSEFVYNEQSLGIAPELKVKIARSAGYDFDAVLNAAAACSARTASPGADPRFEEIARRYFDNRDYFIKQLTHTFINQDGEFGVAEAQVFNQFFTFLQTRVAIVLIKTTDFETAYSIFGILNNRGLPLNNTDLLRNFVIGKLSESGEDDSAAAWYRLENEYALTEDFTARWVESKTGSRQRQSAFNGIQRIFNDEYEESPIKSKIGVFYEDLKRDLSWYSLIAEPVQRIINLRVRNSVTLIAELQNLRYSTTLLLAAFRAFRYDGGEPDAEMMKLLKAYERFAIAILLQPGRRFSSTPVYQSIRFLKDRKFAEAANEFALESGELECVSRLLEGDLDNTVAKLLIGAHVWHLEAEVEDVVEQTLDLSKATLEHIMPGTPASGSNWLTEFSESFRREYTNKLGNMTLLTHKMNSTAKNSDFAKKRAHYARTLLGITRELATLESIGETFIRDRHQKIVAALRSHWELPN